MLTRNSLRVNRAVSVSVGRRDSDTGVGSPNSAEVLGSCGVPFSRSWVRTVPSRLLGSFADGNLWYASVVLVVNRRPAMLVESGGRASGW